VTLTGTGPAVRELAERVRANISRVIVGKDPIVELLLVALLPLLAVLMARGVGL